MTETSFIQNLDAHGLVLCRDKNTTLQVNVGRVCDLACRHCHLEAGPLRQEIMSREVMAEVIACARRLRFDTIDITGGAPELVPDIESLVTGLAPLAQRLIVRTNLTALARPETEYLPNVYARNRVVIVASLPATNVGQTDAQRGGGVWETSIAMLRRLNGLGYGCAETGLELDLVANPTGAFLPPAQDQAERRFRSELSRRYGITFNYLFTFANVPLGRFRDWLECSGNLAGYLKKLEESFNPCTLPGLMCRTLISVDWDGSLYDCDFNLAAGLPHGGRRQQISGLTHFPPAGTPIPTGDHCYACTAGSGFT